jgi:hypothetical protein
VVQLVSWIQGATGGFFWVFTLLGAAGALAVIAILRLPGDEKKIVAEAVAAE